MNAFPEAFRAHRALLAVAVVYSLAVFAEAVYFKVPADNLLDICRYIAHAALIPVVFMAGVYVGALCGHFALAPQDGLWRALRRMDAELAHYVSGRRFAWALAAFIAMQAGTVFLISKSLIRVANPFSKMNWDITFAGWDKLLHFGSYPHTLLMPLVDALRFGRALDWLYFLWFAVMTAAACYNLFGDNQPHRRLRYLWGFVLSWIILGTLMATYFSSAGPVFFNTFFPEEGGPYDVIILNIQALSKESFLFADGARRMLIGWLRDRRMFDPNAISAMPSMHVAIAWLIALYAREIGRALFIAAALFCAAIFAGSVYFGFHYAIDGYVSIICVTVIWWVTGKCLDRRYARDAKLDGVSA